MKCCAISGGVLLGALCCMAFPLAISICFCVFYWGLWDQSKEYDDGLWSSYCPVDEFAVSRCAAEMPEQGWFDTCGGIRDSPEDYINTQWSVVFQLNAIVFLVHTILTGLLLVGTIFPPFIVCGGCGHCYSGCAYLATIIVTAVFRFRAEGEDCAKS